MMKSRILLVEDDESVAYMLDLALTQAGFEVQMAQNGLEGWQAFQTQRPDMVLSDIKMPKMDGIELLSKIRAADPSMDVIILTGHGGLPTAMQAVELGAYRYWKKPIKHIADLIDTLQTALERRRLMRDRELIDRIGRDLGRRLSLDDFLDRFLEHILDAFPQIDAAFLSLYDPDEHCLIIRRVQGLSNGEELIGLKTTPTWRLGGQPLQAAEPVRLQGSQLNAKRLENLGVPEPLVALGRHYPNMGVVGVPIVSKDIIIGSLAVFNFQTAELMDEQLMELLTTLCQQVGLNMRNATLFADLQAQTSRLEAVLDSSPDGLMVIDNDGQVIMADPQYQAMFSLGGQLDIRAQRELIYTLKACLQDKECASFMFSLDHPTSDEPTVLEVSAAYVNQGDDSIGIVANLRDVTLLHGRERQRSDMLRLAKHEIGTPLAVIRAHVHNMLTLKSQLSDKQRTDRFNWIAQQAEEVDKLVEETLSYSEFKESLQLKKQTNLDLSQLANELAQETALLAAENCHQFVCQVEPDLRVIGSYFELKRAFRNLLDNARKFTPAGGAITWRAWREESNVHIRVEDTGIGIALDDQSRIFEPYYRGGGCDGTAGAGLGLSIVRDVISAHRGKIWVESVEKEGSCFRVTLLASNAPTQSAGPDS